jgi:lactoylglutathione lyase
MQRPFLILGLQQVAIGGKSKKKLGALWAELLGVPRVGEFKSESENVDEDILRLGSGPFSVEVDLMEPIDESARPRVQQPVLNHIGLWVDDLRSAVAWLTSKGVRFAPGGIRPGASGYDVCFIHPRASDDFKVSGEGVLIELVQAPKEVIEAYRGRRIQP